MINKVNQIGSINAGLIVFRQDGKCIFAGDWEGAVQEGDYIEVFFEGEVYLLEILKTRIELTISGLEVQTLLTKPDDIIQNIDIKLFEKENAKTLNIFRHKC